jgi:ABC-type multidrug transport system fused ATPase/permease subunit
MINKQDLMSSNNSLYAPLLKIIHSNLLSFITVLFLMVLSAAIQSTAVFSFIPLVDILLNQNPINQSGITQFFGEIFTRYNLPVSVFSFGVLFLVLTFVKSLFLLFETYTRSKLIFKIIKDLTIDQFSAFLNASWRFYSDKDFGLISNTMTKETEKVTIGFDSIAALIAGAVTILFYLGILFFLSVQLTFMVVILACLILLPISIISDKFVYSLRREHTSASNFLQSSILNSLNAIKLIIGYNKRKETATLIVPAIETVANTSLKFTLIRFFFTLINEPLVIILALATILLGQDYLNIPVAELIVFLFIVNRTAALASTLIANNNGFVAAIPSFEQIYALKNEAQLSQESQKTKMIQHFKNELCVSKLDFYYGKHQTLKNISISIQKGKMTSIVGPSGSGKSTLIDILMGYYKIQDGSISIDEVPFEKINLNSWRDLIGYIPQQPFLFNASIRDNILWANSSIKNEDIISACKLAHVHDFVMEMKDGYETIVGERGMKLSGGQAQRICLARAIASQPEILILDEATSSLDSNSESLIQESIDSLKGDITIISVAHRLSTIVNSNHIYYLEEGCLIEDGTFNDLMSKRGRFYKAAKLQGM